MLGWLWRKLCHKPQHLGTGDLLNHASPLPPPLPPPKCPAREAFSSCDRLPPAYVIVDRSSARYPIVIAELAKASFMDVTVIAPVKDSHINRAVKQGRVGWHDLKSPYARMGLTMGHANAWRDVLRRDIPQALVFEDDVVFHEHFCMLLPKYAQQLTCEPSVVYLGSTMRSADGIRSVHVGGEGVPPWDTHAYLVSHEAADLMTRRFDFSFMRMNISQLIPMPVVKQDRGWDAYVSDFGSMPGPMLADGAVMNADFFMMHTYHYYAPSRMRRSWAWFDSTAKIPAQVGVTKFVRDPWYALMPRFAALMKKATPCFCGAESQACLAQWTELNARAVDCVESPQKGIETIVRGTGLVYQSWLTPCTSICSSLGGRFVSSFAMPPQRVEAIRPGQFEIRSNCLTGIQERVKQSLASLQLASRPTMLVDPATHNNLGDNMIMLGEMLFAQKMDMRLEKMCGASSTHVGPWTADTPRCLTGDYSGTINPLIKRWIMHKPRAVLLLHGGGNWGDLYRHCHTFRLYWLEEMSTWVPAGVTVVSMPQSLWYNTVEYQVKDSALIANISQRFAARGADLVFTFRDRHSYGQGVTLYPPPTKVLFMPDVAFLIDPFPISMKPALDLIFFLRFGDGEGTVTIPTPVAMKGLVAIRVFARRQISDKLDDLCHQTGLGCGATFDIIDWSDCDYYKSFQESLQLKGIQGTFSRLRANATAEMLSKGRVVVTDRLHASIMALLIGKPHVVMPTKQNKTKWVREAAFELSPECAHTDELLTAYAYTLSDAVTRAVGLLCQQYPQHKSCVRKIPPTPAGITASLWSDCSAPADRKASGATTHYTTRPWSGIHMQHWAPRSLHMARLVGPEVKVLMDLGAGARALERDVIRMHNFTSLTYIPVDVFKRGEPRMRVCDFNNFEFPLTVQPPPDVIVVQGVMEYVYDKLLLLRLLREAYPRARLIGSYHAAPKGGAVTLGALWVTHLSGGYDGGDFEFVMKRAGWHLTSLEPWEHSQKMFTAEPLLT